MCIIIHKPKGAELDPRLLHAAKRGNPHGVGFMFPIADGTVSVHKGLMDIETVLELWDTFKDENLAIHFRWSTGGKVDTANAHPFRVLDKEEDGRDLWMMHNGVLGQVGDSSDFCDTYHFVKDYMTPLFKKQPSLIDDPKFVEFLGESIGFYNKLLFMDGNGKVIFVNKDSGEEKNGIWASSKFFLEYYNDDSDFAEEEEDDPDVDYGSDLDPETRTEFIKKLAQAIDNGDEDTVDEMTERLGDEGESVCDILESLSDEDRKDIYEKPWQSSSGNSSPWPKNHLAQ